MKITHELAHRLSLAYADVARGEKLAGRVRESDEAKDRALYWHTVAATTENAANQGLPQERQ